MEPSGWSGTPRDPPPVADDRLLRLGARHLSIADLAVELVLDGVLRVWRRFRFGARGFEAPSVAPPSSSGDQVVVLVITDRIFVSWQARVSGSGDTISGGHGPAEGPWPGTSVRPTVSACVTCGFNVPGVQRGSWTRASRQRSRGWATGRVAAARRKLACRRMPKAFCGWRSRSGSRGGRLPRGAGAQQGDSRHQQHLPSRDQPWQVVTPPPRQGRRWLLPGWMLPQGRQLLLRQGRRWMLSSYR